MPGSDAQPLRDLGHSLVRTLGQRLHHDKRPINGVRRLMEINYVRDWRDREQLAVPDQPITCAREGGMNASARASAA